MLIYRKGLYLISLICLFKSFVKTPRSICNRTAQFFIIDNQYLSMFHSIIKMSVIFFRNTFNGGFHT